MTIEEGRLSREMRETCPVGIPPCPVCDAMLPYDSSDVIPYLGGYLFM